MERDDWDACAICLQFLSTSEEETQLERFARKAKALKHNYRAVGYLDVEVEYEANPLEDIVHLIINIQEEPHYIIQQIVLEVVPDLTPAELKELWGEVVIEPHTECSPAAVGVSAWRLAHTDLVESITCEIVKMPELGEVDVIYRLKLHPKE